MTKLLLTASFITLTATNVFASMPEVDADPSTLMSRQQAGETLSFDEQMTLASFLSTQTAEEHSQTRFTMPEFGDDRDDIARELKGFFDIQHIPDAEISTIFGQVFAPDATFAIISRALQENGKHVSADILAVRIMSARDTHITSTSEEESALPVRLTIDAGESPQSFIGRLKATGYSDYAAEMEGVRQISLVPEDDIDTSVSALDSDLVNASDSEGEGSDSASAASAHLDLPSEGEGSESASAVSVHIVAEAVDHKVSIILPAAEGNEMLNEYTAEIATLEKVQVYLNRTHPDQIEAALTANFDTLENIGNRRCLADVDGTVSKALDKAVRSLEVKSRMLNNPRAKRAERKEIARKQALTAAAITVLKKIRSTDHDEAFSNDVSKAIRYALAFSKITLKNGGIGNEALIKAFAELAAQAESESFATWKSEAINAFISLYTQGMAKQITVVKERLERLL